MQWNQKNAKINCINKYTLEYHTCPFLLFICAPDHHVDARNFSGQQDIYRCRDWQTTEENGKLLLHYWSSLWFLESVSTHLVSQCDPSLQPNLWCRICKIQHLISSNGWRELYDWTDSLDVSEELQSEITDTSGKLSTSKLTIPSFTCLGDCWRGK